MLLLCACAKDKVHLADAPSLGSTRSSIAVTDELAKDAEVLAKVIEAKGTGAKSVESKTLVKQIQGIKQSNEQAKANADNAQKKLNEWQARQQELLDKVNRLGQSAKKRNTWVVMAWYGSPVVFLIGYLLAKMFMTSTKFAGPWGWLLNLLLKVLPLPVVMGLLFVLAGGLALKLGLALWSGIGGIWKP